MWRGWICSCDLHIPVPSRLQDHFIQVPGAASRHILRRSTPDMKVGVGVVFLGTQHTLHLGIRHRPQARGWVLRDGPDGGTTYEFSDLEYRSYFAPKNPHTK